MVSARLFSATLRFSRLFPRHIVVSLCIGKTASSATGVVADTDVAAVTVTASVAARSRFPLTIRTLHATGAV